MSPKQPQDPSDTKSLTGGSANGGGGSEGNGAGPSTTPAQVDQALRWVQLRRAENTLRMEEVEREDAEATTRHRRHLAEEAGDRAAWEPDRQEMDLRERRMGLIERLTSLIVAPGATIFAMVTLSQGTASQPLVISTAAGASGLTLLLYRWRLSRRQ